MTEMIDGPWAPGLLPALEANLTAFWLPYGHAPGSRMTADASGAWFYTGVPHPLFNGVITAFLAPDAVAPLVETIDRLIHDNGAPAFWWAGPRTEPADLGRRLEALGLQPAGDGPGMAAELRHLPVAGAPIPGFTMELVDGTEAQALWARTAARGTGFSPAAADALVALERTLSDPGYRAQRRYIGFLDGEPVATSALVLEAGVAGIYAVATLPEVRKRGIGRLMTLVPLVEARDLGYRVGVLQASSMGRPVYETLGFSKVGTYRIYLQTH